MGPFSPHQPHTEHGRSYQMDAPLYQNGNRTTADLLEMAPASGPPPQLQSQHGYGDSDAFPSWESAEAVSVRDLGAQGDGIADDTAVLEDALLNHCHVYLPKGVYRVGRSLHVRPGCRMTGLAHHLVVIVPLSQGLSGPRDDSGSIPLLIADGGGTSRESDQGGHVGGRVGGTTRGEEGSVSSLARFCLVYQPTTHGVSGLET